MQQQHKWTLHPACEIFPPMSDDEFQKLKADIKEHGVLQDIISWRGQIIDGRHRIEACKELGIQWDAAIVEIDDDQDPIAWALSCNLHRRHLNASQLSMVSDKVRGIYDAEAKERQVEATVKGNKTRHKSSDAPVVANFPQLAKPEKKSRDKAAAAVGVSGKLVDAARKVRRDGIPELAKAVESGKVAVTAAALVAALPVDEQRQVVDTNTVKQKAAEVRTAKKDAKLGGCKQAAQITARELKSVVTAFLRLNPSPEDVEPVLIALEDVTNLVEQSLLDVVGVD